MNWQQILRLELKNLLTGQAVLAGLLTIFLAGLYAIHHGEAIITAQQGVIDQAPERQSQHLTKMLTLHGHSDPLNALYYLNFFTGHAPSDYAAVSIGVRDVNPYNLKIRLLTLEGQLYDGEISNPATLAAGNFDLSFLLIFLYPLLIIALLHNTLSSEVEQGIWPLLISQRVSPRRLITIKALVRFLPVIAVWLATLLVAVIWLDLPLDRRLPLLTIASCAYLIFWFAIAALIIRAGRSSNFNALAMLGIWLVLTILIPAMLNVLLARLLPVPEAFDVTIRQREGYHQQWDRPKAETMERFFQIYPEYRGFTAPADKFSWGWYYAAQHLGDAESEVASRALRRKLDQRREWTDRVSWFIPTIGTQIALNRIAGTEFENHLSYLDSVRDYHERLRHFFYRYLMTLSPGSIDWEALPKQHAKREQQLPRLPPTALPLLLISVTAAVIAFQRRRY